MTITYTKEIHRPGRKRAKRIPPFAGVSLLGTVERVSSSRLTFGTVVWAHVPFADGTGEKTRPVVVLQSSRDDVEVLSITTAQRRLKVQGQYVEIEDLDKAGLHRPCAVRLSPVKVERIEVVSIAGRLGPKDEESLRSVAGQLLIDAACA